MMKSVLIKIIVFSIIIMNLISIGCTGPQHFNDLATDEEKESVDVIPYLNLKEGDVVADLGAGGGYFSFRLAQAVGATGKIFALDIDQESVLYIKKKAGEAGLNNVEVILATYDDSRLKPGSIDLVFIRNAYHDIQNRTRYFSRLKSVLKPGGRIAIIDYDPAKLGLIRKLFGHALEEKTIISEMKQAGYVVKKSFPVLKEQSFNIFISK